MKPFRAVVAFFRSLDPDAVRVTVRGTVTVVLAALIAVFLGTGATLGALVWVSTPPSSSTMYTVLTRSVTLTEIERRTDSASTTPEAAFTTDLAAATTTPPAASKRTDAFVQQIIIRNTSSDLGATGTILCYKEVAWAAAATTCTSICAAAAATITCTGAATDGRHITPGMEISTREDGTVCGCVVGVLAGTAYQTHRITR